MSYEEEYQTLVEGHEKVLSGLRTLLQAHLPYTDHDEVIELVDEHLKDDDNFIGLKNNATEEARDNYAREIQELRSDYYASVL